MTLENNYHDRECAFLIMRWGPVSHLCFWRILKVRLKMLQSFCLLDCNSEGDKIDSSLWLSVSMLFGSTCWPAAVGDYCRFLCQEQCGNSNKSDLNWLLNWFKRCKSLFIIKDINSKWWTQMNLYISWDQVILSKSG